MGNIKEQFIAYQNGYNAIIGELLNGYSEGRYQEWKGFVTVDGPIIERPAILFVGINPGPGLYEKVNYKQENKRIPFRILDAGKHGNESLPDSMSIKFESLSLRKDGQTIALDWFIRDNFKSGSWYDGKPKNSFPWNMIKILCKVAELRYGEKFQPGARPKWYDSEEFGKNIMHLNVSPIATKSIGELNKILKLLNQAPGIDIRDMVVNDIQPKVIVFEGKQAYDMFIGENKKNELTGKIISGDYKGVPFIAFSRNWGWHQNENLQAIAQKIVTNLD